jgi:hypothetical protein
MQQRPRRPLRRRAPIGARARRRILAGGPRATGRRAASREEWAAIRELVLARARWCCQACGLRRRLDVHHVIKRAQGGSDFDLNTLVALCRSCHEQTDVPYTRGKLVVTPVGLGQFTFEVVQRAGQGTAPRSVESAHVGRLAGAGEVSGSAHVGKTVGLTGADECAHMGKNETAKA